MKRALLLISPALLVDLFKGGSARAFEVTTHALPDDARFVDVRYINSRGEIALEIESESFHEIPHKAKHPPVLSPPVCCIVHEEELLHRLAARASEVPSSAQPVEVEESK